MVKSVKSEFSTFRYASGQYRKIYTKICACGCGTEYQTTSPTSECMGTHRKASSKIQRAATIAKREPRIVDEEIMTVDEAKQSIPNACPKCLSTSISYSVDREMGSGKKEAFGLSWKCFMCGKVGYPVQGAALGRNINRGHGVK